MRAVLQRVSSASVSVNGEPVGEIGAGMLILVGVASDDDARVAARVARKCADMRIYSDGDGRFNRSLLDIQDAALIVSQFTLLADVRKGRRPSFTGAAEPGLAADVVDAFATALRGLGVSVETGRFGTNMRVELVNEGPVTIVVDSEDLDRPRKG